MPQILKSPFRLWFMWAKSDALHWAGWTLAPLRRCRVLNAGLLNDGTPRASSSSTLHLLQLVLLSTVFEFDGYSNNIPSLACQERRKEPQIMPSLTGGWWAQQTPHHLGRGLFIFGWARMRGWMQGFLKVMVVDWPTATSSAVQSFWSALQCIIWC